MRTLLTIGLLTSAPGFVSSADPVATWTLPEAEGQKWATRVSKVAGRDGWTVEVHGNDIIVRRQKPAAMARSEINAMPNAKPTPVGEKTIKFVLRFAPKMSMDEYERLDAVNAASDKEYGRLHRAVGLTHKFDDFIATTAEEKERVRAFREAVAKLPRHRLPDLYTPDHSIYFVQPWDGSFPADKEVGSECRGVEDALKRYFGKYLP